VVSARHLFSDKETVSKILECTPTIIAVDASLSLPKDKESTRKVDREMQKRGYPVFPPCFRTMEKLTVRAIKLTQEKRSEGFNVIEVHPASTRKALRMPRKGMVEDSRNFCEHGLWWRHKNTEFRLHEIDADVAALTGYLHLKQNTELIGDRIEGYIVVPTESDWRLLKP